MIGLGLGLSLELSGPRFTGLLDSYPGAAAAYSLRALTSAWLAGDVVEVRRSSDSTTQGFTASQITSGAMLDFVNNGTSDLYNSARYFNGASTEVIPASPITFGPNQTLRFKSLAIGSGIGAYFLAGTSGADRIFWNGATNLNLSCDSVSFSNDLGGSFDFSVEHEYVYVRGATSIELFIDGVSIASNPSYGTSVGTFTMIGNKPFVSSVTGIDGYLTGFAVDGTVAYTGLGTSVTAWQDTIGSNDCTETNGAAYTGQPFDGFVSTWYDQSGNGNDATQATTTAQPKIVSAGALVTGGIDFDGVDDSLDSIGALGVGNDVTIYAVLTETDATTRRAAWSVGGYSTFPISSNSATYDAKQDDPTFRYGDGAIDLGASTPTIQHIATGRPFIANPTLTVNGSTRTGLANARSIQDNSLLIGRGIAGTSTLMGQAAELIVYPDATDQSAIETNINDFYSIY